MCPTARSTARWSLETLAEMARKFSPYQRINLRRSKLLIQAVGIVQDHHTLVLFIVIVIFIYIYLYYLHLFIYIIYNGSYFFLKKNLSPTKDLQSETGTLGACSPRTRMLSTFFSHTWITRFFFCTLSHYVLGWVVGWLVGWVGWLGGGWVVGWLGGWVVSHDALAY